MLAQLTNGRAQRGLAALRTLLKNVHDYWAAYEVPEVDESGYAKAVTSNSGAAEIVPDYPRYAAERAG